MPIIGGGSGGGGGLIPTAQIGANPPGGPTDGMLWILPADSTNGVSWMFAYDSTQTTYKWRFVGGAPMFVSGNPNAVINTLTQVAATGIYYSAAVTVARAGDYMITGTADFSYPTNTTANQLNGLQLFAGSTASTDTRRNDAAWWTVSATPKNGTGLHGVMTGVAASTAIGCGVFSADAANVKLYSFQTSVIPIRVI